jgi:hypothetical protein
VRSTVKILMIAAVALFSASGAQAGAALFGARAGAADVPKLAKFYESVFGLQETNRLELPNLFEIMLNFGDSVSAAKENENPQIILMRRESDDIKDTVPHLIFTVPRPQRDPRRRHRGRRKSGRRAARLQQVDAGIRDRPRRQPN